MNGGGNTIGVNMGGSRGGVTLDCRDHSFATVRCACSMAIEGAGERDIVLGPVDEARLCAGTEAVVTGPIIGEGLL